MAEYFEEFVSHGQRFVIRNAKSADAQQHIAFTEQGSLETDFSSREPGEYSSAFSVEDEASVFEDWAKSDDTLYLLAVTPEGEIAASCMCAYAVGKARTRHLADISILVAKKYWRMGLGRRLFEIQMDWAKKNGVEVLTLTVDTRNTRAIGLYHAMGFTVEGTLHRQRKMADGTYRDMYAMMRCL